MNFGLILFFSARGDLTFGLIMFQSVWIPRSFGLIMFQLSRSLIPMFQSVWKPHTHFHIKARVKIQLSLLSLPLLRKVLPDCLKMMELEWSFDDFEESSSFFPVNRPADPTPACQQGEESMGQDADRSNPDVQKKTTLEAADCQWVPSHSKENKLSGRMTYFNLCQNVLSSKLTTIQWLMEQELLASGVRCPHPTCGRPMTLQPDKSTSDGYRWQCRRTVKGERRHQRFRSVRCGSWFQKSNLTLAEILQISYFWSQDYSQQQVQHELGLTPKTTVDWYMFHREICEAEILDSSQPIGGPGVHVQIDESKFGKRKFNRGRRVDGQWVFGGREANDRRKMFMVPVDKRDSATLVPIIKRWILAGSVVVSDCWKAYDCLQQEDYDHLTVNHSIEFVDRDTGACTNAIECEWLHAKKDLPKYGTVKNHLESYLGQHLWRVRHQGEDLFFAFFNTVKRVYNVKTWDCPE